MTGDANEPIYLSKENAMKRKIKDALTALLCIIILYFGMWVYAAYQVSNEGGPSQDEFTKICVRLTFGLFDTQKVKDYLDRCSM